MSRFIHTSGKIICIYEQVKSALQTDYWEQRKQTMRQVRRALAGQWVRLTVAPQSHRRRGGEHSLKTSKEGPGSPCWSLAAVLLWPATGHTTVLSPHGPARP